MEKDILIAILKINKDAEVRVKGDNIDTCDIEWVNGTTEISKADIKAKMTAIAYIAKRQEEYPSIAEQLDMIYHAGQGGDAFQAAIQAVKDKYPKS